MRSIMVRITTGERVKTGIKTTIFEIFMVYAIDYGEVTKDHLIEKLRKCAKGKTLASDWARKAIEVVENTEDSEQYFARWYYETN